MFALVATMSVVSCNKEVDKNTSQSVLTSLSDKNKFENLDYKEIGNQHNLKMMEAFKISDENQKMSEKEVALNINFGDIDKDFADNYFDEIKSTTNEEKHEEILNVLSNQAAKDELSYLRNILYTSEDYEDLCSKIDRKEINIKSNFKGLDYGVLMTYCEITKHSAYLWFESEVGGSGEGSRYLKRFSDRSKAEPQQAQQRTKVESDVLGGAEAMVSWALTGGAVFGPFGVLGGLAAATILGATFGSI